MSSLVPKKPGKTSPNERTAPPKHLLLHEFEIKYMQGKNLTCWFDAAASALHYKGLVDVAKLVHDEGQKSWNKDFQAQIKALRHILDNTGLFKGNFPKVHQHRRQNKNRNGKRMQSLDLFNMSDEDHKDLYIMQLQGQDGHVRHAVAIIDHMVFDSTAKHPLTFSEESLNWCCNCEKGFYKVYYALSWKLGPKAIALGYA
jgi:hypothetical protein